VNGLTASFWAAATLAVFLTGVSKGGFGGALGGVSVPVLSLVISPLSAAAIMLPLLCLTDVIGARAYWRRWSAPALTTMVSGGLVGTVIGTVTLGASSPAVIRVIVGSIAIAFALAGLTGVAQRVSFGRGRPAGVAWSALAGYTSFIAHAGAPPAMVWLLPQRLDKVTYVATLNGFFLAINAAKILPYLYLGQFNASTLRLAAALSPLVPAGVFAGRWLQGRLPERRFFQIAQFGILLTGVQLVRQGATA
jgi:uncharacterized membrane protein YfcA